MHLSCLSWHLSGCKSGPNWPRTGEVQSTKTCTRHGSPEKQQSSTGENSIGQLLNAATWTLASDVRILYEVSDHLVRCKIIVATDLPSISNTISLAVDTLSSVTLPDCVRKVISMSCQPGTHSTTQSCMEMSYLLAPLQMMSYLPAPLQMMSYLPATLQVMSYLLAPLQVDQVDCKGQQRHFACRSLEECCWMCHHGASLRAAVAMRWW